MKITNDRRAKQQDYNREMDITPIGISKTIGDSLDSGYGQKVGQRLPAAERKVAEQQAAYQSMTPAKLSKEIEAVEKQMYEHARNLEFEQAAVLRDRLEQMKQIALGPA